MKWVNSSMVFVLFDRCARALSVPTASELNSSFLFQHIFFTRSGVRFA
jgi:hypothetical protein